MNYKKQQGTKKLYMSTVVADHLRHLSTIKKLSWTAKYSLRNLYSKRLNGLTSDNCAVELKQKGVAHFINETWVVAFWAIPHKTYEADRQGLDFSLTLVTNPPTARNKNGKKANRYRTKLTEEAPSNPIPSGSETLHLVK